MTDHLTAAGEGRSISRSVLPGGFRVITETMPGLASETIGIWVGSGSRHESELTAGSTHFLEHMLFKGTSTRSAQDIARGLERTGGDSNAVTAKEYTCYYARCLTSDLGAVSELLWDMVLDSSLDEGEFERERGVIIEELAMAADDPVDVLFEDFDALVFGDHPLGRPIGATREQIARLPHGVLREHYDSAYTGPHLVIAAAGGATHEEICDLVAAATAPRSGDAEAVPGSVSTTTPRFRGGAGLRRRDTEQQNLLLGCAALPEGHPDRFAHLVLTSMLGGGMASRLFQTIREERGLAYAVHTIGSQLSDVGTFGVYAGCAPEAAQEVIDLAGMELARIAEQPPSADEVADIVSQVAGSTVLAMESSAVRMNRLARHELTGLPLLDPAVLVEEVRAVTPKAVSAHAARIFDAPWALAGVGPRTDLRLPSGFADIR